MAEESHAVTVYSPPAALMRVANAVIRPLLRTPLAGPLRKQLMVVNVTGRKSGRRYSIPLSAHYIDGALYAMTEAAWKNNFRDGADAEVVHDGTTTLMRGELITDPAAVADLAYRLAQKYGAKRAQTMMGLKFRDGNIPTVEEFTDGVKRERVMAVRFTPA